VTAARAVGLLLGVAADAVAGDRGPGAFRGALRRPPAGPTGAPPGVPSAMPTGTPPAAPTDPAGPARGALLLGGALLAGVAVERLARRSPMLQVAGTALATWSVLGGAAVSAAGTALASAIDASDLPAARRAFALPAFAHHDPAALDGVGLARAAVESVAESTSDAVVAPLLWGAVAGVPGLLGYRAVRLLDAAALARQPGPLHRTAALLDAAANLVPSRAAAALTAACAPVVGGSAPGAWQVWRRDGSAHPRPNHGQVEAAFAGALQVRLGGRTAYPHGVQERPVLGHGRMPDAGDLTRSVELSRVVGAAAAAASAVLAVVLGARRPGRRPGRRRGGAPGRRALG